VQTHRNSDHSSIAIEKTDFVGGRGIVSGIILFLMLSAVAVLGQSQPKISLVQITGPGNVFTAAQKAGDLNIFLASWNDDTTTITNVTDTVGNFYTRVVVNTTSGGGGLSQDMWYAANIKASAPGNTLEITTSTGKYMSYLRIHGFEYSGVSTGNVVISGMPVASTGDSAHPNPGGVLVTTTANALLFCATKSQLGDYVSKQPPGFTEIYSDPTSIVGDEADDALNVPPPPPGWYGCSPTLNASGAWITQLVGFAGATPASYKMLFGFNGTDGELPEGLLAQGLDGNFYGTTAIGGKGTSFCNSGPDGGCGTFFKITPAGNETVLYNFCSEPNCTDGSWPTANVVLGANGNFYGMTKMGGTQGCVGSACGTLFEITPTGERTTAHTFCSQPNCADGGFPSWLLQAADGNFYGTTLFGSDSCPLGVEKDERYCGTVFQLTPAGKLTTLYQFCSEPSCVDGTEPQALVQGANGNFYGVTLSGGTNDTAPNCTGEFGGCGTVFELTPGGKLTTLYNFCSQTNCTDGVNPNSLVQGSDGNFYGTTLYGPSPNGISGTVFKITPAGKLTTLHIFCAETNCPDGYGPVALIQATDGNFYGTTGGTGGTAFEITPAGKLTTLYYFCTFSGCGSEGSYPNGLLQATNGNFYGTTSGPGNGTVFSLSVGLEPFVETLPTSGAVGANVTILGKNLTGTSAVSFNGTAASLTIVSSTEITATVPNGATSGTVTVTTSSGTLKSNTAFQVLTGSDWRLLIPIAKFLHG